ncbi:MAG: response regulator [Planctomycetota bacterium]
MPGRKILVIDDEIHIVHVVSVKFRNNGYSVITAENGDDGYSLACREKPDIIVTDFQMPGMTGLEFVEKLRVNKKTLDIPVIMLTARGFAVADEEKEHLHINGVLSKPFSPRELLHAVEDVLHESEVLK